MDGLGDRSRRPHLSPTRIAPDVEALICEMRRHHRRWGARRITYELGREIGDAAPSRSTIHRVLARNGLINHQEQQHKRVYKRWAREASVHLWQPDLVGGIFIAGGRECKMLTGIDDHSRFVVISAVLDRPSGSAVCEGIHRSTCREYGITARLTKRRSPTTTGKIERFHRTLCRELLDETGAFETLEAAQIAIDEWVHARPYQSLDMATPATLFRARPAGSKSNTAELDESEPTGHLQPPDADRQRPHLPLQRATAAVEFDALVPPSGIVNIAGAQQVWVGKNYGGRTVVMWIDLTSVHVILNDVVKTVLSKLTTTDLERLPRRGTRPGRPSPTADAVDVSATIARPRAIEIDRTANRDGVVIVRGH